MRYFRNSEFNGQQTPFLCLRARLSQFWIAPGILVLLLIIIKIQFLKSTILRGLEDAQASTVEACARYEELLNKTANTPRETIIALNSVLAGWLRDAILTIQSLLVSLVTCSLNIILFIFEFWIGTWVCLSITFVNFGANLALDLVEKTIGEINKLISSVVNTVNSGLNGLERLINSSRGLIGTIESFVNPGKEQIEHAQVSLGSLKEVSIPSSVTDSIDNVRNNIPTYDGAKDSLHRVLTIPLEKLTEEIRTSPAFSTSSINQNMFGVPEVRHVQVCNDTLIQDIYEGCKRVSMIAVNVICSLLAIIAAVCIVFYCYTTIRDWRRLVIASDPGKVETGTGSMHVNTLQALEKIRRPQIHNKMVGWVVRDHDYVRLWLVNYITHPPALATILLGVVGLAVSILELVIIYVLRKQVRKLRHEVGDMVSTAQEIAKYEFENWRNNANGVILEKQEGINDNLLGWVRDGTAAANGTLTSVMDDIDSSLQSTFGNSTMYDGVSGIFGCLIGRKVETIERGISWLHENARIRFPLIPDLLTRSGIKIPTVNGTYELLYNHTGVSKPTDLLSDPIDLGVVLPAFNNSLSHQNITSTPANKRNGFRLDALASRLVSNLEAQVRLQIYICTSFIVAWVLLLLGGLIYCLFFAPKRDSGVNEKEVSSEPELKPARGSELRYSCFFSSQPGSPDMHKAERFIPPPARPVPPPTRGIGYQSKQIDYGPVVYESKAVEHYRYYLDD